MSTRRLQSSFRLAKNLTFRYWFYCAVFLIHLTYGANGNTHIFMGRSCTTGGHVTNAGECKLLQDCPSAISNFRAGINPSLCYQEVRAKRV